MKKAAANSCRCWLMSTNAFFCRQVKPRALNEGAGHLQASQPTGWHSMPGQRAAHRQSARSQSARLGGLPVLLLAEVASQEFRQLALLGAAVQALHGSTNVQYKCAPKDMSSPGWEGTPRACSQACHLAAAAPKQARKAHQRSQDPRPRQQGALNLPFVACQPPRQSPSTSTT